MKPQDHIELTGLACVSGMASGPAVLMSGIINVTNDELSRFRGCIWIIDGPLSAGSVVAAIGVAAGIVSRTGGFTCHGANLAREAGIPTVSGITDMSTLRHAKTCVVDGDIGKVFFSIKQ